MKHSFPASIGRWLVRPVLGAVAEVVVDPVERDQGLGLQAAEPVLAVGGVTRQHRLLHPQHLCHNCKQY